MARSVVQQVYVDGVLLHTSTLGGFTPFWVEVPPSRAPQHAQQHAQHRSLVVMASNVFDLELTPTQQANYDFYQYGGRSPFAAALRG